MSKVALGFASMTACLRNAVATTPRLTSPLRAPSRVRASARISNSSAPSLGVGAGGNEDCIALKRIASRPHTPIPAANPASAVISPTRA